MNSSGLGYGHFGAVLGFENVSNILNDNESFTKKYRELVIKYYNENPKTKYIINKLANQFVSRSNFIDYYQEILKSNSGVAKMAVRRIYNPNRSLL